MTAEHDMKLPKVVRLNSRTAVETLFAQGTHGCIAYPLRGVWNTSSARTTGATLQFMVTVPKKKLHRAVDRVTIRRRVREAYRLSRRRVEETIGKRDTRIDLAFVYLDTKPRPYHVIEQCVNKILSRMLKELES